MKPTLCSPLMSISHIQICYQLLQTRPTGEKRYQLLQTHPSAHSLNPPICPFLKPTHPSATNPQPFCLPGDDCRTYGRLTDPKKTTLKIPPSKAWCRLHRANATSPRAAHCIATSSQRIGLRILCITAHRANATSPRAAHRKQSAHRAGCRLHR